MMTSNKAKTELSKKEWKKHRKGMRKEWAKIMWTGRIEMIKMKKNNEATTEKSEKE
jgi:hypothetical protein